MNIKNCKFLSPLKINGIVLYPFVLYCEKEPAPEVIRHEEVHLEQIKRDGVGTFYYRYLRDYFKGRFSGLSHDEAYRSIPYEKEAYSRQNC